MRIFLFTALFFSLCVADILKIDGNLSHISTAKQQICVEDKNNSLTAADIFDGNYTQTYQEVNVGYPKSAFWSKVVIRNDDDKGNAVVFRNLKAGLDKIDVYVFENKKLIQTHLLGDLREQSLRHLPATNSAFYLALRPGQEVTIVTRFESVGPIYLPWDIYNTQDYAKQNSIGLLFWGMFGGIVLALVIYNLNMFLNLKEPAFLFYILHAIAVLWFQYALSGVLYFMDIGINLYFLTLSTWFVSHLALAFLLLFMISIFGLSTKNRKIFIYFLFLTAINFTASLLFAFITTELLAHQYIPHIILVITIFSIFIFAIYAALKDYPYARYFLAGESIYLLSALLLFATTMKMDRSSELASYVLPIGLLCEIMFSSIALSQRVGRIKQSDEIKDKLIAEEAKFSSIGRSIGNITHQWKEPLSRLGSYIVYLQALYHGGNEKKLLEKFGENIEKSAEVIGYMKGSIDELYYFYSGERAGAINVKKTIDLAHKLQQDKLIPSGIAVEIECGDDVLLNSGKHALANTLMILFDNGIHQLVSTKTEKPKIKISVLEAENGIAIYFEDNGGGVSASPVEKIFDASYSSKADFGSGLGLSLAKKLVEERLNGKLSIKNTIHGALFTILIPKSL